MGYVWLTEERLPDGHRLFGARGGDGMQYVIADNSAEKPEDTDDGVLFLDHSRCLRVSIKWAPTIPLVNEHGEASRTPTDAPTMLYLAAILGWTIEDEVHRRYTVTQQ